MSADDYPGPDGETLRRQRLPGAAERWEALPWENRMALLGGLAEEAAEHRRMSEDAEPPGMQERYAALAVTYETAHAALMRADTVSSKDKSSDEVAAERAKYAAGQASSAVAACRVTLSFLRCLLGGLHKEDFHEGAWRAALTLTGKDGANVADLQALYDLVRAAVDAPPADKDPAT